MGNITSGEQTMTPPDQVKRYIPLTNGTAFMGMRALDSQSWGDQNSFYVLASAHDAAIAELRGRWVPWKPGDALPAEGAYWVTEQTWGGRSNDIRPSIGTNVKLVRDHDGRPWGGWDVRAYWSLPLPPPYVPESAATSPTGLAGSDGEAV